MSKNKSKKQQEELDTQAQVEALRKQADEDLAAAAAEGSGSASAGIGSGSTDQGINPSQSEEDQTPPLLRGAGGVSEDESISSSEQSESTDPIPNTQYPIPTIIIPFKSAPAKANEILYAIRAWDKFMPGVRIIIIGDLPKGLELSDQLIHIPHTATSPNPQIDVAQKMLVACESDLVPEYFGWSNDDIYPTSNITISDLDLHTTMGKLGARGSAGSMYQKNAANTLAALKKEGIAAPWDYATHTPVGFHKKELKEVILKFKAHKIGHLVSTLYFNTVWQGFLPLIVDNGSNDKHHGTRSYIGSIFRKVPNKAVIDAFVSRKFINNNDAGWSSVEPVLKKLFPKKSRFEK